HVGAVVSYHRELIIGTRRADDPASAQSLANLHGREPDTAGCRMNEQRLTRLQLSPISKTKIRSLINQCKTRCFVIAHGIRNRLDRCRFCDGVFGKTSEAELREDTLTRLESIDLGASLFNRSCNLEPWNKRKRWLDLILPRNQQKVREVQ